VVGAHALGGEIRVRYFGDGPDTLLEAEAVWLGDGREDADARAYGVRRAGTGRAGEVRLGLEGVDDRDAAEALRGRLVLVASAALAPLEDDEFYWHELVGCTVVTTTGRTLGFVRELWSTGQHDVLVVDAGPGPPILVPTARQIMVEVDRVARRIVVDAIPGLVDPDDGPPPGDGEHA